MFTSTEDLWANGWIKSTDNTDENYNLKVVSDVDNEDFGNTLELHK